jgi:hypothetical protein
MTTITEQFQLRVNNPSDINQHLVTIKNYASECEHVTEMGVRTVVSTWAFLASKPKRLVSMDIVQCPVQDAAIAAKNEGIDFEFIVADTSNPQLDIEPTDLLFIDTWHVYDQLKKEFQLHSNKVKKYIILHDTTTFGEVGESGSDLLINPATGQMEMMRKRGLWPAVEEFLAENTNWTLKERFTHNNGLTILQRTDTI